MKDFMTISGVNMEFTTTLMMKFGETLLKFKTREPSEMVAVGVDEHHGG